jgi:tetratricopeptide (TPR) repeat protein
MAFLSLALSLTAAGCATVVYTPTQDNVPTMSPSDAGQRLASALRGNYIYLDNGRPHTITDAKASADSVTIAFKKRHFLGFETEETDQATIPLKSLQVPPVRTAKGDGAFLMDFPDGRMLLFEHKDAAVSFANALFILARGDEGRSLAPLKDPAAEAAFQVEARKYRELAVKPGLPEEARKYAVQGDFAVEKKNLAVAVARYADALKVAPWWPEGHFKRGRLLADMERYGEAVDEMQRFLLLAPDAKEAREAQDNIYKWESAGSLVGSGAAVAVGPAGAPVPVATVKRGDGKFTVIEVKPFAQGEGLKLSPAFANYFRDGLRDALTKMKVAEQVVGDGAPGPETDAAHSLVVEGQFTEYKEGGFLAGPGIVGAQIRVSRRSDHAPIATLTSRIPFKSSPLNTDKNVGEWTGRLTARPIRDALK